jgi:predicted GIY-YIG superfamily endonuclease
MIGVYAFCHADTRKVYPTYIGMSNDIEKRIKQHKGREYFDNKLIYQTFNDIEKAKEWERTLITWYNPHYNRKFYRTPKMWEVSDIDSLFSNKIHRPWAYVSVADAIEIKRLKGEL